MTGTKPMKMRLPESTRGNSVQVGEHAGISLWREGSGVPHDVYHNFTIAGNQATSFPYLRLTPVGVDRSSRGLSSSTPPMD